MTDEHDTMNQLLRGQDVEKPERVGLSLTDDNAEMNRLLRESRSAEEITHERADDGAPRLPGPTTPPATGDRRTMNERIRDARDARREVQHVSDG